MTWALMSQVVTRRKGRWGPKVVRFPGEMETPGWIEQPVGQAGSRRSGPVSDRVGKDIECGFS